MPRLSHELRCCKWVGTVGCMLFFALACAGGCQSGDVYGVQSSTDGEVIAFEDYDYAQIYVADRKGVRRIYSGYGQYALSPDGRSLVHLGVKSYANDQEILDVGTPITLYDLTDNRRYSTKLPVCVVNTRDMRFQKPATTARGDDETGDPPESGGPRLFFGYNQIAIGPVGDDYWIWHWGKTGSATWTKMLAKGSGDWIAAAQPPISLFTSHSAKESDCVLSIPSDGITALRTVWVRPDGSVMELVRKNDVPLLIAAAAALPLGLPIVVVYDLVWRPLELKCPGAYTGFYIFGILGAWHHVCQDLEVDQVKFQQSQEQLRYQIDLCRRTTTSQPTSMP